MLFFSNIYQCKDLYCSYCIYIVFIIMPLLKCNLYYNILFTILMNQTDEQHARQHQNSGKNKRFLIFVKGPKCIYDNVYFNYSNHPRKIHNFMLSNLPLKSYCKQYTDVIFMGIHKNFSLDLSLKSGVWIIHRGGLYVVVYGSLIQINTYSFLVIHRRCHQ